LTCNISYDDSDPPQFTIYGAILRHFPEDLYNVFKRGSNLFSTTLHVLASAVAKLARSVRLSEGSQLYRGLGGTLELPDSFFRADALGRSGFCEWSFMSTTADKKVAVQYSGAAENKPAPTVLVMTTGAVDRGACVRDYSQHQKVRSAPVRDLVGVCTPRPRHTVAYI
jgi:hypothetical protein